jgi:hypothetical protein
LLATNDGATMEKLGRTYARAIDRWWSARTRSEKVAASAVALIAGGALVAMTLPEVAVTAAGGAVTAAAAWVAHKGLAG